MTVICAATTRKGLTCRRAAQPNGRCYMHGGKSLSGIASPTFKTGRYSKVLPAALIPRYQQAASDPDLLNLRDEIALLDARIGAVLGTLDTGESGRLWERLQQSWLEVQASRKDAFALVMALDNHGKLIQQGDSDRAAWQEVRQLLQERKSLIEGERKRLEAIQNTITVQQALVFANAVAMLVKEHVSDRDTLTAIQDGLRRLIHVPANDRVVG